jgi:hypothetical protein
MLSVQCLTHELVPSHPLLTAKVLHFRFNLSRMLKDLSLMSHAQRFIIDVRLACSKIAVAAKHSVQS